MFDSVHFYVRDVIAPDQKWRNYVDNVFLVINKVNKENSTFAGTYEIVTRTDTVFEFPFRGEFDPEGITIGWVVTFWNKYQNDHSLGAWAGYAKMESGTQRAELSTTRIIAHESTFNTTTGYDTFVLQSD